MKKEIELVPDTRRPCITLHEFERYIFDKDNIRLIFRANVFISMVYTDKLPRRSVGSTCVDSFVKKIRKTTSAPFEIIGNNGEYVDIESKKIMLKEIRFS